MKPSTVGILATIVTTLTWPGPLSAQIQPLDAATLLRHCTAENLPPREACATFILQSVERNRAAPEPAFCLPASAILGDLRARFIAWGQTRPPEGLGMAADDGLAIALAEAFPCPLTQSG
jgi:hypothetical protein